MSMSEHIRELDRAAQHFERIKSRFDAFVPESREKITIGDFAIISRHFPEFARLWCLVDDHYEFFITPNVNSGYAILPPHEQRLYAERSTFDWLKARLRPN